MPAALQSFAAPTLWTVTIPSVRRCPLQPSSAPNDNHQDQFRVPERPPACRSRKFHPRGFAQWGRISASSTAMLAILHLFGTFVLNLFKSRRRLEVENLFLRHQLNCLEGCIATAFTAESDRVLMVCMTRLSPNLLGLARGVQPATILRWHRAGFRTYWRWKSRGRVGRPGIGIELRDLIRRMSRENPLWGAPRMHGEIAEARIRDRRIDGLQVRDATPRATVAELADIPAQPRRRHRRDRSLRSSDRELRAPICVSRSRPSGPPGFREGQPQSTSAPPGAARRTRPRSGWPGPSPFGGAGPP